MEILIPVSAGSLLDQITILQIKYARIPGEEKRDVVLRELMALTNVRKQFPELSRPEVLELEKQLARINEELWDIEDEVRALEGRKDFGPDFIAAARKVYLTNDRRAKLKREIDRVAGSKFWEEKSFRTDEA
jgi:hypothetical protein